MARWSVPIVLLVAAMAGCTDFDAERQNALFVHAIDVSAPDIGSGRIVLLVNTTLDNALDRSGDLEVRVKAFDLSTGLLVEQVETQEQRLRKDETRIVSTRLDLPRAPGYRLDVSVLQDGKLLRGGSLDVSNLDRLEPNRHDAGLRVTSLDFEVLGTQANRTTVRATVYLTNEGHAASRPLSLQLKAREASTGLLAGHVWANVGSIGLEATRPFNASLALPSGYNYVVEAVLWDGEIIVERGEGQVNFVPTVVRDPGQDIIVTRPNLDDFASDDADGNESATPGPGLAAIALALAVCAVLAARRRS